MRTLLALLTLSLIIAPAVAAQRSVPIDATSNCMDGEQPNETCRDDVYYLGGPANTSEDRHCEKCPSTTAEPPQNATASASAVPESVPAAGVAVGIIAVAAAMILVPRRR